MFEEIFVRSPWVLIPLVALFGVALIAIVWIVSAYWHTVQKLDIEAKLKQDMLNRGFSPANIERVLRASAHSTAPLLASGPAIDNEFALAKNLLDEGYPLADIDQLVRTLKREQSADPVLQGGRAILG